MMIDTPDLFDTPICSKKVRKNVTAYQYRNGVINIAGRKYISYSMTNAIRLFRKVKSTDHGKWR